MEGIQELPRVQPRKPSVPLWPGLVAAILVAAVATVLHALPLAVLRAISAAIYAMVLGMLVRNLFTLPGAVLDGSKRIARAVIPATIVLTGAGMDLSKLAQVGLSSFAITVICIAVASLTAVWIGKILGVWPKTSILIGAGTAICGTSAVVAVAPLIEAEDEDLMLSIGTINVLGLALMFLLPALGSWMHMKDDAFGVWAGTSIHAVPQVVAAAFAYSPQAGALATLVKLVRVALLAPFMFVLGLLYARKQGQGRSIPYARLVPTFVWGFLALALLNTFGLFPVMQFRFGQAPLAGLLTQAGELLLTLSMAAMGLEVNVRFFAKVGGKAVLTGIGAAGILCACSLGLIRLLL